MEPNSPEIIESGEVEILRVRGARHQISERFEHDPHRLVARLLERQESEVEGSLGRRSLRP